MSNKISKTDTEWKVQLSDDEYTITRQQGTEQAFTGKYHDCKDTGEYVCKCCGLELFSSDSKFDSGSGWPSFFQPVNTDAVEEEHDNAHNMTRIEVHCSRCDAHLGHVFPDGPKPTGLRYCINSASLDLKKS